MNWWLEQKQIHKEALNWGQLGKGFGVGVATMGLGTLPFVRNPDINTPQPSHQVTSVQEVKNISPKPEPAVVPTINKIKPIQTAREPSAEQPAKIDIAKIIQIESSGKTNAVSPVGAAGLMQVMPKTWEDIAKKIGKYQGFDQWKFNEEANVAIGSYYMNTEIPKMLKSFGLPDIVDTRLAAYNWGIGNLNKAYKQYGDNWKNHLPEETKNYLKRYYK